MSSIRARGHLLLALLVPVTVLATGCSSSTSGLKPPVATYRSVAGWLDGVDCLTATSCVAVGNAASPSGAQALVETLDRGSWSPTIAPPAQGSRGDYLFSVSCPRAGSCVAVGYSFTPTGTSGTGTLLIETLSNGNWALSPTPSLGSSAKDSFLYGVSCTTSTTCVAVGSVDTSDFSTSVPLILTLSRGTWSVAPTPSLPAEFGVLQSVSCPGPMTCTAVGYQATSTSTETLVESFSGGSWSITPSPGSEGSIPGYGLWGLTGISCTTSVSCVAVGQLAGPGPIIATLTNEQWSATSTPNPDSSDAATGLYGVSCSTTTTCLAVGALGNSFASNSAGVGELVSPIGALIETFSGGTWSVVPTPVGLPPDSGLHDVSCVGQTCVAVGQSGQVSTSPTSTKTLILET